MNAYVYIIGMCIITAAIRILPLLILRRPIRNRFLRSFFYYVPYVTLSVMTFPAIVNATANPLSGTVALVVGIVALHVAKKERTAAVHVSETSFR